MVDVQDKALSTVLNFSTTERYQCLPAYIPPWGKDEISFEVRLVPGTLLLLAFLLMPNSFSLLSFLFSIIKGPADRNYS
jgi:hypothetical protein